MKTTDLDDFVSVTCDNRRMRFSRHDEGKLVRYAITDGYYTANFCVTRVEYKFGVGGLKSRLLQVFSAWP